MDPAGRQGGDAARLELQAGVGDVDLVGEDMDARGADDADLVLDQGQDDVQVVDHEVQDDVDVQRPGRERPQPLDFDELRVGDHVLHGLDGRVEPLQVPDLEDEPVGLGLRRPAARPARPFP